MWGKRKLYDLLSFYLISVNKKKKFKCNLLCLTHREFIFAHMTSQCESHVDSRTQVPPILCMAILCGLRVLSWVTSIQLRWRGIVGEDSVGRPGSGVYHFCLLPLAGTQSCGYTHLQGRLENVVSL